MARRRRTGVIERNHVARESSQLFDLLWKGHYRQKSRSLNRPAARARGVIHLAAW